MKISIGARTIDGPYGGGNEFLKNLIVFLKNKNHTVINHLNDKDIDIILLTNPLITSETSTFNSYDIEYYLKFCNADAIVFQRFNECDERKGTRNINKKLDKFNKVVDINIYVSYWLKNIFKNYDLSKKKSYVIKGGPNKEIFNTQNKNYWDKDSKLKIVTHHWSNNLMKGYEVYKEIDELLNYEEFNNLFEFTIIGNIPKYINFKNTNILKPINSTGLSNELKKHDIYLTASQNEPSGNHHMEGALCGLPILYIESGALPEYCHSFGKSFEIQNFKESLNYIVENYYKLVKSLESYPYDFLTAANDLIKAFEESQKQKKEIIYLRKKTSLPSLLFRFILNKIHRSLYKLYIHTKSVIGKVKYNFKDV